MVTVYYWSDAVISVSSFVNTSVAHDLLLTMVVGGGVSSGTTGGAEDVAVVCVCVRECESEKMVPVKMCSIS